MQFSKNVELIYSEELKTTNDIMADMTRQYKSTQEELMLTDKNLNQRITENDAEITRLREKKEELIRTKKEEQQRENTQKHDTIW